MIRIKKNKWIGVTAERGFLGIGFFYQESGMVAYFLCVYERLQCAERVLLASAQSYGYILAV
jgi:hypothetical protein